MASTLGDRFGSRLRGSPDRRSVVVCGFDAEAGEPAAAGGFFGGLGGGGLGIGFAPAAALFQRADFLFDSGALAGDLGSFDGEIDLGLAELFLPLALELLEVFALFADDLVLVENFAQGGGPHGHAPETAALVGKELLQVGDLALLLGQYLIGPLDDLLESEPLGFLLFVLFAEVGLQGGQDAMFLRLPVEGPADGGWGPGPAGLSLRELAFQLGVPGFQLAEVFHRHLVAALEVFVDDPAGAVRGGFGRPLFRFGELLFRLGGPVDCPSQATFGVLEPFGEPVALRLETLRLLAEAVSLAGDFLKRFVYLTRLARLQGFQLCALTFDLRKPALHFRAAALDFGLLGLDFRALRLDLCPIAFDFRTPTLDLLELACPLGSQLLGDAASLGLGVGVLGGQLLLLFGELGDPLSDLVAEGGDVLGFGLMLLAGQRERLLVVAQLGLGLVDLGSLAIELFAAPIELLPLSLEAIELVIELPPLLCDFVELLLQLAGLTGVEVG